VVAEVTLERLKRIPLTQFLPEGVVREQVPFVQEISLHKGEVLFDVGQPECLLYFVEKGKASVVEVDPSGRKSLRRQASQGQYLGVYTLITGRPCLVNATAEENTTLIALPLQDLHDLLLPGVETRRLAKDQVLYRKGEPADFLYYVESGKVAEWEGYGSSQAVVHRYATPGDYLGRYALVTGRPFQFSTVAEEETSLLAIPLRYLQPLLFVHEDWRGWFFQTDIATRLRAIPLFINIDDWDIYRLADAVDVEEYDKGETIFASGQEADSFYIVDQGQVLESPSPPVQPGGDWPRYYAAGNFFGRRSLRLGQRRWTTAVTQLPTRLFRIPGQMMQELLADRAEDLLKDQARISLLDRLQEVSLFASLSREYLRLLTGYVCLEYHRPGDILARQGDPATSLMILEEGEAVVRLQVGRGSPRPVTYLKAQQGELPRPGKPGHLEGNYFGAHALLADEMRGATVEVTQPSIWIVLKRKDFERFLDDVGLNPEDFEVGGRPDEEARALRPSLEGDLPLPYKVRRHWFVPVSRITPLALFLVLVLVLILADVASGLPTLSRNVLLALGITISALLAFSIVYRYFDWRNDTYEITNRAVIHTEKNLFLSEQRYEIPLNQIQNVNIFVTVLGRQLGYGNVAIDTAAQRGQIHFTVIPHPAYVQELIQRASAQARSGLQIQQRESIRHQLEDRLYPERLEPRLPDSMQLPPESGPDPEASGRQGRFRSLGGWLPRFEIRENGTVTWRKHWINLLQRTGVQFLVSLLAVYLLLAFALAYATEVVGFDPVELPPVTWVGFEGWLFLVFAVLGILAFLWFLYQYVDWRNDVYIVTDTEVVDVERELAPYPFFFFYTESRRQASLANVQYVDFRIPSPLAMILNYGNVIVQTAGAEGRLDFLFVSNPRRVHDEVLRRLTLFQERQREREFKERWGDMPQWFEAYRDLLQQTGPDDA
jgi:CRP-like cAMP-binding protein/membrane protein YdbS with pleckstrin-like domain